MNAVFRYRPAAALLTNHEELKNREIYFAPPSELNDPLDGFKDIYWKGDAILWNGLLKHYLLCLLQTVLDAMVSSKADEIADRSYVFSAESLLPTPQLKQAFRRAWDHFRAHPDVAPLPGLLAARKHPVRRYELSALLRVMHLHAVNSARAALDEATPGAPPRTADDLLTQASKEPLPCRQLAEANIAAERQNPRGPHATEALAAIAESFAAERDLLFAHRKVPLWENHPWKTVLYDFPASYVLQLEQLLYQDWYTACFVESPDDAAMWGNYGDSHKGICLKFRTHPNADGTPCLRLQHATTHGGSHRPAENLYPLNKVKYRAAFIGVDFFRSLGALTRPMLDFWCRDETGKPSPRVAGILAEKPSWRKRYWATFERAIATKLKDWKHEREHRLTLHSQLGLFATPAERKLIYRFEDLQGIIFGLNTQTEDKLAIIQRIEQMCAASARTDFEFHQAMFLAQRGKMVHVPLRQLKFASSIPTSTA